ncbi:hypothetical protein DL93DRAFT_2083742 [Clavulina sp. PMI_390]|nr:hypothetical protein DL93DRAFT_2083742 [Clavulina sp. PMI_390]
MTRLTLYVTCHANQLHSFLVLHFSPTTSLASFLLVLLLSLSDGRGVYCYAAPLLYSVLSFSPLLIPRTLLRVHCVGPPSLARLPARSRRVIPCPLPPHLSELCQALHSQP